MTDRQKLDAIRTNVDMGLSISAQDASFLFTVLDVLTKRADDAEEDRDAYKAMSRALIKEIVHLTVRLMEHQ